MNSSEKFRAIEIQKKRVFTIDDIPLITRVFQKFGLTKGTDWDYFSGTTLDLPEWFDLTLIPNSTKYKKQQINLWKLISGRDREYCPQLDENAEKGFSDPNTIPGWFSLRSVDAITNAANHFNAIASILRHSGVSPGDRILEYGAGSGEIAINFSRLGVQVDTVDISPEFCSHIQSISDFYQTNLTSFNLEFGANPRGEMQKYSLILFYEAFHHALNFEEVARKISSYLLPGGRVMLAGEPIVNSLIPAIPYPWGMRLDVESVVVTRSRGWLELGFQEDYICSVFSDNNLTKTIIKDFYSHYGNLYIFERIKDDNIYEIKEKYLWKNLDDFIQADTWHLAEENGRWSKENSYINLGNKPFSGLIIFEMENPLPVFKNVSISLNGKAISVNIRPNQSGKITIEVEERLGIIEIFSTIHSPKDIVKGSHDGRSLGVFFKKIIIESKKNE